MILDAFTSFSYVNSTTPTDNLAQVQGTYYSNNVIDLGGPGIPVLAANQGARDLGVWTKLKMLAQVITAFTSGGAATLTVTLQGAADNGSGAATTYYDWWASPAYALATLAVAGARLFDMDLPRPPAGISIPRFLRLKYVIGGATTTAGTVGAYIVLDRPDQFYASTGNAVLGGYPAGITVAN